MATVQKNIRGELQATDRIELGSDRVLKISTYKNFRRELVTTASVHKLDGGFETHVIFQDFSVTVLSSQPARCTARVIAEQHDSVMANSAALVEAAQAHYNKTPVVA